jgi:hypothetical protein
LNRRIYFAGLVVAFAAGLGAQQAAAPVTNTQPAAYSTLQIRFADAEVPKWNGAYLVLANPPSPAQSLQLFKNGQLLTNTADYRFVTAQAVQLTVAYDPADTFIAWYRY